MGYDYDDTKKRNVFWEGVRYTQTNTEIIILYGIFTIKISNMPQYILVANMKSYSDGETVVAELLLFWWKLEAKLLL